MSNSGRSRFPLFPIFPILFLAVLTIPARASDDPTGPSAPALSNRVASYTITADLDVTAKRIRGRETLRWRNPSSDRIRELQFHLYLNAFRDWKSTFMVESGGQLRGDSLKSDDFGQIDIESMRTDEGENLAARVEFIQPDTDNKNDRTVLRVPLSRPVEPGGDIVLHIEFLSKLPRAFARTGFFGNYFFVAQWFPKIGVYEPAGMRGRTTGGWNCHEFHGDTEFYADFGVYDVTFTVPSDFKVGATGVLASRTPTSDGRTAHRYVQTDVHDFAWTASPDFLEFTDVFDEPGLRKVTLTLLLQPEHLAQRERHFKAVKNALRHLGTICGAYPYDTLTAVDPPYNADGSGGMEYPTLITCGTIYRVQDDEAVFERSPEVVVVHEFAHQYWYGMVASNEVEEPWLDEGMTSYFETDIMEACYADKDALWFRLAEHPVFRLPIRLDPWNSTRRINLSAAAIQCDPILTLGWRYKTDRPCSRSYVFNSYSRPALTLKMLEGYVGKETMRRIFRTYFERWKFRHPTSQDFFDTASEVSGQDLKWFFDQYFRTTEVLDHGVKSATSERVEGGFKTEVVVQRLGAARMPTQIEFRFEDGATLREPWDGREPSRTFSLVRGSKLVSVHIDPDDRLTLDTDRRNNGLTLAPSRSGEIGLLSRIVFFLQQVLQIAAF